MQGGSHVILASRDFASSCGQRGRNFSRAALVEGALLMMHSSWTQPPPRIPHNMPLPPYIQPPKLSPVKCLSSSSLAPHNAPPPRARCHHQVIKMQKYSESEERGEFEMTQAACWRSVPSFDAGAVFNCNVIRNQNVQCNQLKLSLLLS